MLCLAAALCGAGLGALFPRYTFAAFEFFVWKVQGRHAVRIPSNVWALDSAAGAFLGFVLTWITSLVILSVYIVIKEPRPRW